MERTIQLSTQAKLKGEIPVGCIIIDPTKNIILSESFDTRNSMKNPLRHAIFNCISNIASLERSNRIEKSEVPQKRRKLDDVIFNGSSKQREDNNDSKIMYLCKGYDIFVTHEPCIM